MHYTFEWNGAKIQYQKTGLGQAVLLLHGFGEDSNIWNGFLPALEPLCQVIVPDLPGTGGSDSLKKEGDTDPVTIEDYADCMYALAQYEGIEKYIVLGHSMGGYIALAMAENNGSNIEGLGLLHSTAFADTTEKKDNRRKGIEMIRHYGGFSFLKNTIPNLFSQGFKQKHPEVVAELVEKSRKFSDEALIQYYEMMIARPDRTGVLSNAGYPVLFIIGTDDVAAPLNDLLQQISLPKISYVHILNGVGHMGMLEATNEFNNKVTQFIMETSAT